MNIFDMLDFWLPEFENIRGVHRRPYYISRKLNRLFHRRAGLRSHNPRGMYWLEEDWDVLTILDACRYDTFKELSNLPGRLRRETSVECSTAPVLRINFDGKTMDDIVYVTAMPVLYNGQHDKLVNRDSIDCQFHAQFDVWVDGWTQDTRTVMPELLGDRALSLSEQFPNKRIIIHFSQPHCPFIGKTGRKHYDATKRAFWKEVMEGRVETKYIRKAYRENLESVLPIVADILTEIRGKHVVTSDHGQLLGERAWPVPNREWGHPRSIYVKELVTVPWLEYFNGERRDIICEPPVNDNTGISKGVVKNRLADLGYVSDY